MRRVGAQLAAPWDGASPAPAGGNSCEGGDPGSAGRGLPRGLLPALLAFPADTRPRHGVQASFRDGSAASLTRPEAALLDSSQSLFNGSQQVALGLAQAGLNLRLRLRTRLVAEISQHMSCGRGRSAIGSFGS